MTEAHVYAIADTPVPADVRQETEASAKAKTPALMKATAKPSSYTSNVWPTSSTSSEHPSSSVPTSKQPPTPPPTKAGKGQGKGRQNSSHRDWNQKEEPYYTGPRPHRGIW